MQQKASGRVFGNERRRHVENLDDLDPRILAAFKLEMRRAVADCMDRPNDKSAREVSLDMALAGIRERIELALPDVPVFFGKP